MKNKRLIAPLACLLTASIAGLSLLPAMAFAEQPAGNTVQQAAKGNTTSQNQSTIPDPLDWEHLAQDPADYGIPKAVTQQFGVAGKENTFNIPAPKPGGVPKGAVPQGLEAYYSQTLNWGNCADFDPLKRGVSEYTKPGVQCAYVIVPVDYNNPNGERAAIALAKIPAKDPAKRIGSLLLNPGGPGGSGTHVALAYAGSPLKAMNPELAELNEKFDIIGFDPRGVAASVPQIRCYSSAEFDAQRQGSETLKSAQLEEILKHNTDACYKNTAKGFNVDSVNFLNNVGTKSVINDVDLMRSALGDEKLTYLGWSYGTSIGFLYAQTFPDNVRAIVDDGQVDVYRRNPADLPKEAKKFLANGSGSQLEGFEATFFQFIKRCGEEDGFKMENGTKISCALGTKEGKLMRFGQIAHKAWGGTAYETKEADVKKRRPLTYSDFRQGLLLALYSERFWPHLNKALADLRDRGDATEMMNLSDQYYDREANGLYAPTVDAFRVISCTDYGVTEARPEKGVLESQMSLMEFFHPFLFPGKNPDGSYRGTEPVSDDCTYFKNTKGTIPKAQKLHNQPNVLIVSSSYDPSTPHPNGVVSAWDQGASILTVQNASHTAYPKSACASKVVNRYLLTLEVAQNQEELRKLGESGASNVETKDLLSNVIKGDECQISTEFRQKPKLGDVPTAVVEADKSVALKADGLVRGMLYVVKDAKGNVISGDKPLKADENGVLNFNVTPDWRATAGEYTFMLLPVDGQNDPYSKVAGKLQVSAYKLITSKQVAPATADIAVLPLDDPALLQAEADRQKAIADANKPAQSAPVPADLSAPTSEPQVEKPVAPAVSMSPGAPSAPVTIMPTVVESATDVKDANADSKTTGVANDSKTGTVSSGVAGSVAGATSGAASGVNAASTSAAQSSSAARSSSDADLAKTGADLAMLTVGGVLVALLGAVVMLAKRRANAG